MSSYKINRTKYFDKQKIKINNNNNNNDLLSEMENNNDNTKK